MSDARRNVRPRLNWFGLAGISLGLAAWAPLATAAVAVPMTLNTLADHAGQVIVGRVTAVRSYWASDPRRIESAVTLEGAEYLKGRLADSTDRFTLIVPGGEVDKTRMTIPDAPELRVGEKWLLFLLPTYHTHPVVGIYQGAFLIKPDADGVERVMSRAEGREAGVAGVGSDGFIQYAPSAAVDPHESLQGAEHMGLVTPRAQAAAPVAYTDFVTQLTPVLAASRDHQLTAPAGRPAIVKYRAVPLRLSPMEQRRQAEKKAGAPAAPVRGAGAARPAAPPVAPTTQPSTKGKEVPR